VAGGVEDGEEVVGDAAVAGRDGVGVGAGCVACGGLEDRGVVVAVAGTSSGGTSPGGT
jgi:hypothetical protein